MTCSGQKRDVMEEDHTGRQGTEQNVELEKKNKKKRNKKLLKPK